MFMHELVLHYGSGLRATCAITDVLATITLVSFLQ